MIGTKCGKNDNKECGRIFTGIDQMRKGLFGITISSQTLSKSKPGGQTIYNWSNGEIRFHTLTCICKTKIGKKKIFFSFFVNSRSCSLRISIRCTYFPLPANFHWLCRNKSNIENLVMQPQVNLVDRPARNQRIQRRKMVLQSFDPVHDSQR